MNPIELVRSFYSSFNEKNWAGMLALVHDDVIHYANQSRVCTGKSAFVEFVEKAALQYDEWLTNIVIFTSEDPGRLAAEFVVSGTYKTGGPGLPEARGQKYVLPAGAFIDVRDGKIYRITTYYNLKDWIDQVGSASQ